MLNRRKPFTIYIFITLLLPLLLIQGCRSSDEPSPASADTGISAPPPSSVTSGVTSASPRPGEFTVRYDPEDSLNPITCVNRDNIVLSGLLYESLFILDSELNVIPVLCESWRTEDNLTYTITIKPDIAMSDGSVLTADDVVYTLTQAMQTGRYVNRLSGVSGVDSDGELTVTVVLKSENNRFIRLLDIPIIKYGSIDDPQPPGSGAYNFSAPGSTLLTPFPRHRDYQRLPLQSIRLFNCDENEMAELFEGGRLSLLWDDPFDTFNIILNGQNEMRLYETTTMQFIGFNTRLPVLKYDDVRRAIGSSIDRQKLIDDIFPGEPLPAPLALSPAYRLYDEQWAESGVEPLKEMTALLQRSGLDDFDSDSYLEFPDDSGGFTEISLDFIVNSENTYKVQAAHRIADTLRLYGFQIVVRELPWDSFTGALQSGTFDMYYGEISLSADFDLSPLLLPGGALDYGSTGSDIYEPLLRDFLTAGSGAAENGDTSETSDAEPSGANEAEADSQTADGGTQETAAADGEDAPTPDELEQAAAKLLCDTIDVGAPFVPILYKRYAVFTQIGAVTGASPGQSGVFCNFADWSIDLTALN